MSNSEHSNANNYEQNWSNRGSNRANSNSNREEALENYENVPRPTTFRGIRSEPVNESRLAEIFSNMSDKRPTLEDVKALVRKLKFTRVQTKTPGERVFAHVLPGSKQWILIAPRERQSIEQAIFASYRSKPPNPTPIPASFKITRAKKRITIREIIPERPLRVHARPVERPAQVYRTDRPRVDVKESGGNYDPLYEERTKYGIRPKGWTEADEEKYQIQELVGHSRHVIRGLIGKSEKARERWRMAAARYRESENRNREHEFNRRRIENKARREAIKKEYRNKRVAPVNTRRIPTRISVHGIFPKKAESSNPVVINKEKLALASARMRERRAAIERERKPVKVIPARPIRWTEKMFTTPRAKKCTSYTKLELSKLVRKYGDDPVGMSQAQMCEHLERIYMSLKNNNE